MNLNAALNAVRQGTVYAGIILFSDAAGLAADSLLLGRNMFHYFTLLTLAEAALLFLLAGVLDIGGSLSFSKLRDHMAKTEKGWSMQEHRRAQSRAAPLIVTGVILFVLSFVLAYPLD